MKIISPHVKTQINHFRIGRHLSTVKSLIRYLNYFRKACSRFEDMSESFKFVLPTVLDATSKVPAGILIGNIWDLGMFDECVQVIGRDNSANIQGQHCMVSLALPTKFFGDVSQILNLQRISVYNPSANVDLSLTASVCLPSSCDESDINGFINASIASTPVLSKFEVGVAKVKCSNFERYTELTLGSILAM